MRDDGVFHTDFDRFGVDDGVAFVMAFYRAGFRWGAIWTSPLDHPLADIEKQVRKVFGKKGKSIRDGRVDTMHFELELSPAQVAARDYAKEIEAADRPGSAPRTQSEEMAPAAEAAAEPRKEDDALTPEEHDLLVQARENSMFIRRLAEHLDIGVPVEPGQPWADALATRVAGLLAKAAGEPSPMGGDTRGLEDDLEPAGPGFGDADEGEDGEREIPTEFEPIGD
jgi:hypothetical protein